MKHALGNLLIWSGCSLGTLLAGSPAAEVPASPDAEGYPVFPGEDQGADPSIPAEKGGRGFGEIAASLGWATNVDFGLIGDLRARKGGEIVRALAEYPSVYRPVGASECTHYAWYAFESLLVFHPDEMTFIPGLASHWKVTDGGRRYSFRINPNARWADGSPVTSEDVVATYTLLVDPTLGDPVKALFGEKFGKPVADGPCIVSVEVAKPGANRFHEFACDTWVFPAKVLKRYKNAGAWAADHARKFMMGSGPYEGRLEDQTEGSRFTLRRRADYWAANTRAKAGLNNFDRITRTVIDESMGLLHLEKGDIDLLCVTSHRQWGLDLSAERSSLVRRGLIQKARKPNEYQPQFFGIAMNMDRPPYDDIRVRKALALLLDRRTIVKRLLLDQCVPLNSFWAWSPYANPDNPPVEYDPKAALALLAEAGWKTRDDTGMLVNGRGETLQVKLLYSDGEQEKYLTVYQESLKQAGVALALEKSLGEVAFDQLTQRKFGMANIAFGTTLFPLPEWLFRSTDADRERTWNFCGVRNERMDALLDEYEALGVDEGERRIRIAREIDGLAWGLHAFIPLWDCPHTRFAFRNVFGFPARGFTRAAWSYLEPDTLWWYDAEKASMLAKARNDDTMTFEKVSLGKD